MARTSNHAITRDARIEIDAGYGRCDTCPDSGASR